MHNSKLATLLNAIKHLILLNAYMIIYICTFYLYIYKYIIIFVIIYLYYMVLGQEGANTTL